VVRVALAAPGATLDEVFRWPRPQRAAVAVQMVAASAFLLERGWLPSGALLRGCRVERRESRPWLRLGGLPRWRVDAPGLERRLRRDGSEGAAASSLVRTLGRLLPESAVACRQALERHRPWEGAAAVLGVILAAHRAQALRHPLGDGRALWARKAAVPDAGAFQADDETIASAALTAAVLRAAAAGRSIVARSGCLDDTEISRLLAGAAGGGQDALVVSLLPDHGIPRLGLAVGGDCVWVLGADAGLARNAAVQAVDVGRESAEAARQLLEAGAATAFARPARVAEPEDERLRLASAGARRALGWLRAAPAGLSPEEVTVLAGAADLEELARLRLAWRRGGVWFAAGEVAQPDQARVRAMAERLPPESPRAVLAAALSLGRIDELRRWCEDRLEQGGAADVLPIARSAPGDATALLAAEAALALGRLTEAERLLESVGEAGRGATWNVLAAWLADQAGLPARVRAALENVDRRGLAARLSARVALLEAELAWRRRDGAGERRLLEDAARGVGPAALEAEMALAVSGGAAARRAWRRRLGARFSGDLAARACQRLALSAAERGSWFAAATALRAALRLATGENPRLLGEIHSDLGSAASILDRPGLAERHLGLAQRHLEACGSRRGVTVVQFNRGGLACDRLDWRAAEELLAASRRLRGAFEDGAHWVEELEFARARLARGDAAAVAADVPRIERGVAAHPGHEILVQSLAALRAQLALATGELRRAEEHAAEADDGERELVLAVVRADSGVVPPPDLPPRWGLSETAALLAAWRGGRGEAARRRFEATPGPMPLEAAVGLARFAAILGRAGERLPETWLEAVEKALDALESAALDGWAESLRGAAGGRVLGVLRALEALVAAGSGGAGTELLERLARVAGLRALEVLAHGRSIASVGDVSAAASSFGDGDVVIRAAGDPDPAARAALSIAAHVLTAALPPAVEGSAEGMGPLVGPSRALQAVREEISRWGPLPVTVLVQGEPGTGKELVARELHRASGRRGTFVAINCAGVPASLLEAELFGVARGAFTGADRDRPGLVEAAEGGTLFLDEIGEMPLELQGKLLRMLQEREVRRLGATRSRSVDVRFVAATNRDLAAGAAAGSFRPDLFYRLAVAVIIIPPLRERPDDVPAIAGHLVSRLASEFGRPGVRLSPAALAALREPAWPGNVRELESVLVRAVASARPGEVIGPERLPGFAAGGRREAEPRTWEQALAGFRREYFTALLESCGGNRSEAARRAGISRQALLYHLKELGIGRK
jgi:DNA-binding NtrC family response regulator